MEVLISYEVVFIVGSDRHTLIVPADSEEEAVNRVINYVKPIYLKQRVYIESYRETHSVLLEDEK